MITEKSNSLNDSQALGLWQCITYVFREPLTDKKQMRLDNEHSRQQTTD